MSIMPFAALQLRHRIINSRDIVYYRVGKICSSVCQLLFPCCKKT